MKWVKLSTTNFNGEQLYGRIDDDGLMRVTCIAEYPEFADWLADGNEPEAE